MNRRFLVVLIGGSFMLACGDSGGSETSSTGASATDSASDTDPTETESASTSTTDPTSPTASGTETEGTFIQEPDGGAGNVECDIWAQDCPKQQKCMPWANDGGSSWNATKCSPLSPNPKQVGDTCTVEGGAVSGVDDCEIASMCYYVNPETNMGVCTAFCQGSEANPLCEDPSFLCSISNDGVLILCRVECDPLLQDCEDGTACLQANGNNGFVCIVDASGPDAGAWGDPCEFLNSCDPGLWCASAEAVPGCQGSGCCTEFCDLTEPDPDAACSGQAMGQVCEAWFMDPVPGLEHVGGCVIPQG